MKGVWTLPWWLAMVVVPIYLVALAGVYIGIFVVVAVLWVLKAVTPSGQDHRRNT